MTAVTPKQIIQIIKNCPNLALLDIKDCRNSPRGWSHKVKRQEFPQLIKLLNVKMNPGFLKNLIQDSCMCHETFAEHLLSCQKKN